MHRRTLLRMACFGAALAMTPVAPLFADKRQSPILVLVELNGGNDSLNTVVPLEQLEAYRRLRPQLGLQGNERLALDERFALHKALEPLMQAWLDGDLALVHGLGYPKPNRSHFRSIEIWDTASTADEYRDGGWLAEAAPALSSASLDALVFGRNAAPVSGQQSRILRIDNLEHFSRQAGRVSRRPQSGEHAALDYLAGLQNSISKSGELLISALKQSAPLTTTFPDSAFGRHLADAARMLRLDMGIPVIKVALGSFDTHQNQRPTHARLLLDLAAGLAAFRMDMISAGLWHRVTVMTYSEFGRRAAQNGTGGTDHGTAATHFLLGGKIRGGHFGAHPSLSELADQDMLFTTDFRQLYQTLLSHWWKRPDLVVPGEPWKTLPLFRST